LFQFKVQSSKFKTQQETEILLVVLPAGPNFALSPSIDDFIFLLPSVCIKISFTVWVGCCLLKLPTDLPADFKSSKFVTTFRCETICGLLCDAWKTILNTLFD